MPSPTDRNLTALPTKTVKPTRRRQTRHFTQLDQVTQLVAARNADPDMGFMARLLALCSLPRTNPGNQLQYVRRNGPFALVMTATGLNHNLPYGNLPRLVLAWVCQGQEHGDPRFRTLSPDEPREHNPAAVPLNPPERTRDREQDREQDRDRDFGPNR